MNTVHMDLLASQRHFTFGLRIIFYSVFSVQSNHLIFKDVSTVFKLLISHSELFSSL